MIEKMYRKMLFKIPEMKWKEDENKLKTNQLKTDKKCLFIFRETQPQNETSTGKKWIL